MAVKDVKRLFKTSTISPTVHDLWKGLKRSISVLADESKDFCLSFSFFFLLSCVCFTFDPCSCLNYILPLFLSCLAVRLRVLVREIKLSGENINIHGCAYNGEI
jgi:hypothetical protein